MFRKKNGKGQNIENLKSNGPIIVSQASGDSKIVVNEPNIPQKAKLQVVDVFDVESEDNLNTILEFKFRNSGGEVAFLKSVTFKTLNHWDIYSDQHPKLKEVSAEYDLKISEVINSESEYRISHEIKSQETDRIRFKLTTDYFGDPLGLSLFLLKAKFIYNENNEQTTISPILVHIPTPVEIAGSYFPGYANGTVSRNKAIANEIFEIKFKEFSLPKHIENALKSWLNATNEG